VLHAGAFDFREDLRRHARPVILDFDESQRLARLHPLQNFRQEGNAHPGVAFAGPQTVAPIEP